MVSDQLQAFGELVVFGRADATFPALQVLVYVQAEHADMPDRARVTPLFAGQRALGIVFD